MTAPILLALFVIFPASVLAQSVDKLSDKLADLRFEGRIEASRRSQVANSVNGFLTDIHFTKGDRVEAGQLLFSLSSVVYEHQVNAAQALLDRRQIELAQAEANVERVSKLEDRGTATQVQLEDASARLLLAKVAVDEARIGLDLRKLELASTTIAAPITGYIDSPRLSRGAYLKTETGKPLAEIVQVDPALVSFAHPYDSLLELHHVAPERISEYLDRFAVHVTLPTGERYEQVGKVAFVGTELNSDGALQVWAEIPNPEVILIPGLQVSVSIELKK